MIKPMNAKEFAKFVMQLEPGEVVDFATDPGFDWPQRIPKDKHCSCWHFARRVDFEGSNSSFVLLDYYGGNEAFAISFDDDLGVVESQMRQYFGFNSTLNGADDIIFVQMKEETAMANFYSDWEKMLDMREMDREEFLKSYSYLTEEEYDATMAKVNANGGLNGYPVSSDILDLIRRKDEIVFRMAVSHLMDVGVRHLTPEGVDETCNAIMEEDDSQHFMTNRMKCQIVRVAGQIARVDHIHLLVYLGENVYYDVGQKGMSIDRTKELLHECMSWINEQEHDPETLHDVFDSCGFADDELVETGYGWVLTEE